MTSSLQRTAILFDFDGTLFHTRAFVMAVGEHMDEQLRGIVPVTASTDLRFSQAEMRYITQLGGHRRFDFEDLLRFWFAEIDSVMPGWSTDAGNVELARRTYQKFIADQASQFVYPETTAVLDDLRGDVATFGLFTQGLRAWQLLKFSHSRLAGYFPEQFQFVSPHKTEPEFLQSVASALQTQPGIEQVLVVDDSPDVMLALAAGWPDGDNVLTLTRCWLARPDRNQLREEWPDIKTAIQSGSLAELTISTLNELEDHLNAA